MTYPREIIDKAKAELNLSDAECTELSNLLQEPDVQALIEREALNIQGIIHTDPKSSKKLMMSKGDLARLVANQIKIDALKNPAHPLKLSDLYFWVTPEGAEAFCYVINPSILEKFTNPMYFGTLTFLRQELAKIHKTCPSFKKIEEDIEYLASIANISSRKTASLDFINRNTIEDLENFLAEFSPQGPLAILYAPSQEILKRYVKQSGSALRKTAKVFYTEKFRAAGESIGNITFSAKKSGAQFGVEMQIARDGKEPISYFIKSHQNGPQFSSDRRAAEKSTESLELKEIFVYHALAALKKGPKADIFFVSDESIGGVYISTRDLAYSKKHPSHTKFFSPYDRIKEEKQQINNEQSIEHITLLDVLARLFRLHDMNQGNFGRVVIMEKGSLKKEQWKFVDFRTPAQETYTFDNIIGGFLEGNGTQSYERAFQLLLLSGSEAERLKRAIKMLSMWEQTFDQLIEDAYIKTIRFLDSHRTEIALANEAGSIENLEKYKKSVIQNFHQFLAEARKKVEQPQPALIP